MGINAGSNIKTLKKAEYLQITYCDPKNHSDKIDVRYKLRSHQVVPKWKERLISAQQLYTIDDPQRFYGFGDKQEQIEFFLKELVDCVDTINSHKKIIDKQIEWPISQDTFNYLHHIFEIYHGLLDKQNHEFFVTANDKVKKSLAKLNILVHKGESILKGSHKRHVITYFGLPKTKKLSIDDYELLTDNYRFGTIYLNYVEIGKTLEDLAVDNDNYIDESAFKPFRFYSADFVVMFNDTDPLDLENKKKLMEHFYNTNLDFFKKKNLELTHPFLKPGRIPLADIDSHGREVLPLLEKRQFVKSVLLV